MALRLTCLCLLLSAAACGVCKSSADCAAGEQCVENKSSYDAFPPTCKRTCPPAPADCGAGFHCTSCDTRCRDVPTGQVANICWPQTP